MTRWNSLKKGHRGDETEDIINITNAEYERQNLAIIKKMPVPIKVIEIDKGMITKAFFEEKSIVDYMGVVQGYPICFDAKETENKSLPLQNIHKHQIEFMENFCNQKGIAFIIANFKHYEKYLLIPLEVITDYYYKSLKGGRKSIPYKELDETLEIKITKGGFLDYLTPLNKYMVYIKEGKYDTKE